MGFAFRQTEAHPHPHRGQQALWDHGSRVRHGALRVQGIREQRPWVRHRRTHWSPQDGERSLQVPRVDRGDHRRGPLHPSLRGSACPLILLVQKYAVNSSFYIHIFLVCWFPFGL